MKIVMENRLAGVVVGCLMVSVVCANEDLQQEFQRPPLEAKPWVYWWFQGGYGNPDGMARDLVAMKEKGIGGVMHMQTCNSGGRPVPSEPKMLGPEWDAWFGEALRLAHENGLTMSASILDGWSHGGGWVGKEDGAKQLVHAETQIDGPGVLTEPLPQPFSRIGVYHDVAVVAFKEKATQPPVPLSVTTNSTQPGYCGQEYWPAAHATDQDPETFWKTAGACSPQAPACLQLAYARPIVVTGAWIAGMKNAGPAECEVQVSDDGQTFRAVAQATLTPGESKRIGFAPVTARHFRLSITRAHAPDLQLAEFQLLRQGDEPVMRRGIMCWDLKSANFGGGWGGWPTRLYQALEDEYPEDRASDVAAAAVVDLTNHLKPDGRLDWKFPAGRWTVMRFGWTAIAAPARMGNGGGYEVDVLSRKGADLMMDTVAKRMRDLSVKQAGGAPIIFHTDSWEIGADNKGQQPTWTDDFRQQFLKRRGYDLLPYLPAMARRLVNDRQMTDRFLWDFRATVADLLAGYYGRLQERAHQLKGSMNSESGYGSFPHPHMDGLQLFGRSERPMAEFWHPYPQLALEYLQEVDVMRTAASGARIYGNRFVQAETLTSSPTAGLFTAPADYRRTLHGAWSRGLNQAVVCLYTHQPSDDKPGMLFYDIFNRNFSWWPLADGFIGYMGRCQSLLQKGEFVADVAYFVGEGASRFVPGKATLNPALPLGYDYDGINAEVLFTRAKVKDGRLVLPPVTPLPGESIVSGPTYRYLVLCDPQCVTLTAATLGRMHQLVQEGLTLVGKRPLRTPGLEDLTKSEAEFKRHVDALWGASPAPQGENKVGKGRVVWGRTMGEIFAADAVAPDCEWVSNSQTQGGALEWIHRKTPDADIYFLTNPLKTPLNATVALRANGRSVQWLDPLDGSARDLPETTVQADGRLAVPLQLEAEQAAFVVVRNQKPGEVIRAGSKNFPVLQPVTTLDGPWTVTFDGAWVKPLPVGVAAGARNVPLTFDQLTDWSKRPEPGIQGYSGLAQYRKVFDLEKGAVKNLFLDFGVLKEMARVELNGRDLGVVWCPPWRAAILPGLLKPAGNHLVITVANTWNNRLWADGQIPENERLCKVGHGLQGGRVPQPAGLIGPVRLMAADGE
jgi:hypothetical protein